MLVSRSLVFIMLLYLQMCSTHTSGATWPHDAATRMTTATEAQWSHTQRSFSGEAQSATLVLRSFITRANSSRDFYRCIFLVMLFEKRYGLWNPFRGPEYGNNTTETRVNPRCNKPVRSTRSMLHFHALMTWIVFTSGSMAYLKKSFKCKLNYSRCARLFSPTSEVGRITSEITLLYDTVKTATACFRVISQFSTGVLCIYYCNIDLYIVMSVFCLKNKLGHVKH